MPKKLVTMVGMLSTMVMEARNFMTTFRLLEMIDAKASIMELRMPLLMAVISMACWFSVITSSSRSSSSSKARKVWVLLRCSRINWLAFSAVVK